MAYWVMLKGFLTSSQPMLLGWLDYYINCNNGVLSQNARFSIAMSFLVWPYVDSHQCCL